MLLRQYANARLIAENVEWLSGEPLPAFCLGNPGLYMQCKEDGESLVVGLWNFFEDEAIEPEVKLGRSYASAEILCGEGRLSGDTVYLADMPPYTFRAIVLKKSPSDI